MSKDTLARWLRDVLSKAGVDTQQFGAHSTRVASTSAVWGPQYPCGQHISSLGPTVPVWPAHQQFGAHSSLGPTVPVRPAHRQRPPVVCPWMSYFTLQDGARNPRFHVFTRRPQLQIWDRPCWIPTFARNKQVRIVKSRQL